MYTGVTRGAQVTGIAVMALSLTWISAVLRLYVRIRLQKFFGREDWLMFAAMILLTLFCSLCLAATGYGLGAHMDHIPSADKQIGFKIIFVCEILYVVTTAVTKASIGAYFLRLASRKYEIRIIYSTLAIVLLISTMYFFFLLFQCSPVSFLWTQFGKSEGSCLNSPTLANVTYTQAVMSAITDWSFGILPIFFVWNMVMDLRTKLSVVLVLSLGFFASTATIVRIAYIKRLTDTDDYSWEGINLVKWSMVEPAIAITASNFATLRPILRNLFCFASKGSKGISNRIEDEERMLTETGGRRQSTSSLGGKLLTPEFADMLGLSRFGVTTEITSRGRSVGEQGALGMTLTSIFYSRSKNKTRTPPNATTDDPKEAKPLDCSEIRTTTVITMKK